MIPPVWRRRVEPFTRPLFFAWSRLTRGKTLGVRAVVLDGEGRVLLIEHTYVKGWHLPGGGVDAGETCEAALIRELREEAGVVPTAPPRLLSVHSNERHFPGDHVLVFRVDAFRPAQADGPGRHAAEILNVGFFPPDALPDTTTAPTRRRLAEALTGVAADPRW